MAKSSERSGLRQPVVYSLQLSAEDAKQNTEDSAQTIPVLYQDDELLVIDKPAGLIIEKSHTHDEVTLQDLLPEVAGLDRGGLVHRLDRDTSGVMVVAKTPHAQEHLQGQFKGRSTDKEYTALVWGRLPEDHLIIDAPIARHPKLGYKYVVMKEGREAKTEVWAEDVYVLGSDVATLVRVKIYTGRTHQIRVHMMALGNALVGDSVYGRRKDKSEVRQFLHASVLSFDHPSSGERMTFEAPLAEELEAFLGGLEKA